MATYLVEAPEITNREALRHLAYHLYSQGFEVNLNILKERGLIVVHTPKEYLFLLEQATDNWSLFGSLVKVRRLDSDE